MAFQFPVDKLTLLNRALFLTGNNQCAQLEDGSDEYAVSSPAYEDALGVMMEDHGWSFATQVRQLTPSPTAPANTQWDTAFPLPSDLVHIIWVRVNQDTTDPTSQTLGQPTLYDIENGMLVLNAQGGPPPPATSQTPAIVTIKGVFNVPTDVGAGTPRFVRALMTYVMSGIYRGLHQDLAEADKLFAAAEQLAQQARTKHDQQKPKRSIWNSRIGAVRRVRAPYPQLGNNYWGGTGSSG